MDANGNVTIVGAGSATITAFTVETDKFGVGLLLCISVAKATPTLSLSSVSGKTFGESGSPLLHRRVVMD